MKKVRYKIALGLILILPSLCGDGPTNLAQVKFQWDPPPTNDFFHISRMYRASGICNEVSSNFTVELVIYGMYQTNCTLTNQPFGPSTYYLTAVNTNNGLESPVSNFVIISQKGPSIK